MFRLTLRNLLARKVRLVMSTLAIVLGIGFLTGVWSSAPASAPPSTRSSRAPRPTRWYGRPAPSSFEAIGAGNTDRRPTRRGRASSPRCPRWPGPTATSTGSACTCSTRTASWSAARAPRPSPSTTTTTPTCSTSPRCSCSTAPGPRAPTRSCSTAAPPRRRATQVGDEVTVIAPCGDSVEARARPSRWPARPSSTAAARRARRCSSSRPRAPRRSSSAARTSSPASR